MSDRVLVFDTTLRDGEQSAGCYLTKQQRIDIAAALDTLGVDIIEAGFPVSSGPDFEAIQEASLTVSNATVAVMARAKELDISRAWESIRQARRPRINTLLATSDLHITKKLRTTRDAVLETIRSSVSYAANLCPDVEWTAEDASRADIDFLCRCIEIAIDAGARTVNIADTVGYALPTEFGQLIQKIQNKVPNIDKAVISVHCHDDLGLAVANSLAGIEAGARQVECTINGIGERAGNAALEEIAMILAVRGDRVPYHTSIETTQITAVSKLVSSATQIAVPLNKAIVGGNAFSHQSGIHQHGLLQHAGTYQIIAPETVGRDSIHLVLGKHSGKHAVSHHLENQGIQLDDFKLAQTVVMVKALAEKQGTVLTADLLRIVSQLS